jgi:hypothetical protein
MNAAPNHSSKFPGTKALSEGEKQRRAAQLRAAGSPICERIAKEKRRQYQLTALELMMISTTIACCPQASTRKKRKPHCYDQRN